MNLPCFMLQKDFARFIYFIKSNLRAKSEHCIFKVPFNYSQEGFNFAIENINNSFNIVSLETFSINHIIHSLSIKNHLFIRDFFGIVKTN